MTPRLRLSWSTRRLHAAAAVLLTEAALRLMPLDRAARLLKVRLAFDVTRSEAPSITAGSLPREAVEAVDAVLRRVPLPGTCLRRALAVGVMLRETNPVLHVGVRPTPDGLRAHAWLVVGDETVVEGDGAEDFVPLRRVGLPSSARR